MHKWKKSTEGTTLLSWSYFWIKWYVDSRARAQTERGNTRGGATKKREIWHNLLSINLNFSVHTRRPKNCHSSRNVTVTGVTVEGRRVSKKSFPNLPYRKMYTLARNSCRAHLSLLTPHPPELARQLIGHMPGRIANMSFLSWYVMHHHRRRRRRSSYLCHQSSQLLSRARFVVRFGLWFVQNRESLCCLDTV